VAAKQFAVGKISSRPRCVIVEATCRGQSASLLFVVVDGFASVVVDSADDSFFFFEDSLLDDVLPDFFESVMYQPDPLN